MKKDLAAALSDLMVECGTKLDASLKRVRSEGSAAEHVKYRDVVSRLLVMMLVDAMNPIYAEHPDLRPKELDRDWPMN